MSADFTELDARLRDVVALSHSYPFLPQQSGTPASVLLLVGLREGSKLDELEILITRRNENLVTHKGQYALPGGMEDHEDGAKGESATAIRAALRETEEEVGIPATSVEPIGLLPKLWTPSGFQITPVLGLLKAPIDQVVVVPNPGEIDLWFWCPLSRFRDQSSYSQESRSITIEGTAHTVNVDVFQIDAHRIWGATGAILKNFIGRWEKLG